MKALIQRVKRASVRVENKLISEVGSGLLTFLGVMKGDSEDQLQRLLKKIVELRIFSDSDGKMNLSLKDVGGSHLIVSQFTLGADCTQGKRPSFIQAESPDKAVLIYERALLLSQEFGIKTQGGKFGADMEVELVNDGPATFWLET